MHDLTGHAAELRHLTRTDPDPRVRHRADALLVLAHGRRGGGRPRDMGCCTEADSGLAAPLPGRGADADWPIARARDDRRCCRSRSRGAAGDRLGRLAAGLRLPGDDVDGGRPDRSARAARLVGQPRDGLARLAARWATAIAAPVTT